MAASAAVLASEERSNEHGVTLQSPDLLVEEKRHRVYSRHRGGYRHGRSVENDMDTLESRRHRYRKGRSAESIEDQQVLESRNRNYHYRRGRSVGGENVVVKDMDLQESRRRHHYRKGRSLGIQNVEQDMNAEESRRHHYRRGRSVEDDQVNRDQQIQESKRRRYHYRRGRSTA